MSIADRMNAYEFPDSASIPPSGRLAPFWPVPNLLRQFGVAPETVLEPLLLTEEMFLDPTRVMPYSRLGQLMLACVKHTGCEHFGLLVGQRSGISSLGSVGVMTAHSKTVGSALLALASNFDIQDDGAEVFIEVHHEIAFVSYAIFASETDGSAYIYDGAVAILWELMRALCGPSWKCLEICLSRRTPIDQGDFRSYFNAPIRFNAERTGLYFDARLLTLPIEGADHFVRHLARDRVADLKHQVVGDFVGRVRAASLKLLHARCMSLEELASSLGLHPRTLSRRLKASGHSFRGLVADLQHGRARQLLRDTDLSISAIATVLGFSGATAFNRVFRQREGVSASAWRKRQASVGELR